VRSPRTGVAVAPRHRRSSAPPSFPPSFPAASRAMSAAAPPFAPIFIMGAHRSGTTWLQQLLVETGCFDYVSAFHVICYDRLPREPMKPADAPADRELVETFRRRGVGTRAVDNGRATQDTAHADR